MPVETLELDRSLDSVNSPIHIFLWCDFVWNCLTDSWEAMLLFVLTIGIKQQCNNACNNKKDQDCKKEISKSPKLQSPNLQISKSPKLRISNLQISKSPNIQSPNLQISESPISKSPKSVSPDLQSPKNRFFVSHVLSGQKARYPNRFANEWKKRPARTRACTQFATRSRILNPLHWKRNSSWFGPLKTAFKMGTK